MNPITFNNFAEKLQEQWKNRFPRISNEPGQYTRPELARVTLQDLAAHDFNQVYSQGIVQQLLTAHLLVKNEPSLISDGKTRKRFLNANYKKTAATICNSICTYLYFYYLSVNTKKHFSKCYIDAVASDAYKYQSNKTFAYIHNYPALVKALSGGVVTNNPEVYFWGTTRHGHHAQSLSSMFKALDAKEILVALVRSHTNSHTYMITRESVNDEWICADTYHAKYNGESFVERCTFKGQLVAPYGLYYYKVNGIGE